MLAVNPTAHASDETGACFRTQRLIETTESALTSLSPVRSFHRKVPRKSAAPKTLSRFSNVGWALRGSTQELLDRESWPATCKARLSYAAPILFSCDSSMLRESHLEDEAFGGRSPRPKRQARRSSTRVCAAKRQTPASGRRQVLRRSGGKTLKRARRHSLGPRALTFGARPCLVAGVAETLPVLPVSRRVRGSPSGSHRRLSRRRGEHHQRSPYSVHPEADSALEACALNHAACLSVSRSCR